MFFYVLTFSMKLLYSIITHYQETLMPNFSGLSLFFCTKIFRFQHVPQKNFFKKATVFVVKKEGRR